MKKYNILILVGMCLGLCSCMSVPVGTMIRMSRFGPGDMALLDPNEIRLKVQVPDAVALQVKGTFIAISITEPVQEQQTYRFTMELVRRQHETTGWLNKQLKTNFILRMTPEGVADFVKVQEMLKKENGLGKRHGSISAACGFNQKDKTSTMPVKFNFSLFLKLGKDDDFMTLIDNAPISIQPTKPKDPNQVKQPETNP
jgi:hypothetical protein